MAELTACDRTEGVLEALDRSGRVIDRLPVNGKPITVGRGYDNDLIVDDPYVCPEHVIARPQPDGALLVENLSKVNGICTGKDMVPADESIVLRSGQACVIGRTMLRFRAADFRVREALVDHMRRRSSLMFGNHFIAPVVMALAAVVVACKQWFDANGTSPAEASSVLLGGVATIIGLASWAGLWSLASKLTQHRSYFSTHCTIAAVGLIASAVCDVVAGNLAFSLALDDALIAMHAIPEALAFAAMLTYHLRFCSAVPTIKLALPAIAISATIVGVAVLNARMEQSRFSPSPRVEATLKNPAFRIVAAETPAAFLDEVSSVRRLADEAARETGATGN